jgi:Rieske 2Fe-2S family protein
MQNFNECYHCPTIHPDLAKIHHFTSGENDLYKGPFLGGFMTLNNGMNSITKTGNLSSKPVPGVSKTNLNRVYYSLFPNILISLHLDYVMYHTVIPISPSECKVTCSWLFLKDNNDQYNQNDAIEFWDKTNKQDWNISELSQLGIKSKKYTPGPYSGRESLLHSFDNYYLSRLNK